MADFLSFLDTVTAWHWWALAAILIGIEIISTTFYLFWPGAAAAIVGVLVFFFPSFDTSAQLLTFAVLSVVCTVAWKRWAPESWTSTEPHPTLNRRTANYIGRRVAVATDFSGGRGAITVDDTRWSAVTVDGADLVKGANVEIVGSDGAVFNVRVV